MINNDMKRSATYGDLACDNDTKETLGAFTQTDISHLLPVINVESDTTLLRQKDHTVFSGAMSVGSFCRAKALLSTTFMTGNK